MLLKPLKPLPAIFVDPSLMDGGSIKSRNRQGEEREGNGGQKTEGKRKGLLSLIKKKKRKHLFVYTQVNLSFSLHLDSYVSSFSIL